MSLLHCLSSLFAETNPVARAPCWKPFLEFHFQGRIIYVPASQQRLSCAGAQSLKSEYHWYVPHLRTYRLFTPQVPGKGRSSADQDRLWQFRHDISSLDDFVSLFEQAKNAMGLLSVGANAFTEDILRVEVSGLSQPQLTIVDLPGLIHSHNKHQTERDVELVTNLVAKYMVNPRSIILAVVSAKNDFANQIVGSSSAAALQISAYTP